VKVSMRSRIEHVIGRFVRHKYSWKTKIVQFIPAVCLIVQPVLHCHLLLSYIGLFVHVLVDYFFMMSATLIAKQFQPLKELYFKIKIISFYLNKKKQKTSKK
jgi:hypothetical protein